MRWSEQTGRPRDEEEGGHLRVARRTDEMGKSMDHEAGWSTTGECVETPSGESIRMQRPVPSAAAAAAAAALQPHTVCRTRNV